MPIINKEAWEKYEKTNTDEYGKCCVDVARQAMKNIDEQNPEKFDTRKIICQADGEVGSGGLTGFMAGAVAQMIFECHSRGEEFRKSWNAEHGIKEKEDKGGVVNPAVVTIKEQKG